MNEYYARLAASRQQVLADHMQALPKVGWLLVEFHDTLDEDIYVDGFAVWDAAKWRAYLEDLIAHPDRFPYFPQDGPDTGWKCEHVADYLECFAEREITSHQAAVLNGLFPAGVFAWFPVLGEDEEDAAEEEEDNDE
jgi:hypothetical protein